MSSSNVEELIRSTYDEITLLLVPQESERTVCIYIETNYDESVHGVVGVCVGDNILIRINPLIKDWEKYVPWVLAHEYNHCIWGYNYFYLKGNRGINLLGSVISEGIADSFAKIVCPDLEPNWVKSLSRDQEATQYSIIKDYFHCQDSYNLHCRFFFGDKKTNTPIGVGYTLGYKIVQNFLKNSETSPKDLIEMDPEILFNKSGYKSFR